MSQSSVYLEEAIHIGNKIVDEAYWHRGRCNWLAPRLEVGANGGPILTSLDPSVSSGTAGVALYMAQLAKLSGEDRHRETAEGAIRQSLHFIDYKDDSGTKFAIKLGGPWRFGFYLGQLGVAFAANEVGQLTGDASISRQGRRIVQGLEDALGAPFDYDLMFGAAGSLPALLALDAQGVAGAFQLAEKLGRRLVDSAHIQGGAYSWGDRTKKTPDWSGFSHGAAGIGYALATLAAATKDSTFHEAAMGAFEYERRLYDPELTNWPDYADTADAEGRFPGRVTWCHGAPGIGLARALAYPLLKERILLDDARLALPISRARMDVLNDSPGENMMMCCGLAGVADCVWHMERVLDVPGADETARRFAQTSIQRFGQTSAKEFPGWVDWPTGPAFGTHLPYLKGLAGIGNLLLRHAAPGRIPAVTVPGGSAIAASG